MGAYLNKPITEKITESGENLRIRYAATTMQGWRINQEDAHNCILSFDNDCSLFAVYDGHGGSEVARYTAAHLPDLLKCKKSWKIGEYGKALEETFLHFDEILRSEKVLNELKSFSDEPIDSHNEPSDDEERELLYEEACMPLESILEKYGFALRKDRKGKAIINLEDLHALRDHHEHMVNPVYGNCKNNGDAKITECDDDEEENVNGKVDEHETNDNGEKENNEGSTIQKSKKRLCSSPVTDTPKRTKKSSEMNDRFVPSRRHSYSESEASPVEDNDGVGDALCRCKRKSKSESDITEISMIDSSLLAANVSNKRKIVNDAAEQEEPQPSVTPEIQTGISSDSEQSVDEDYNEDEEMTEDDDSDADNRDQEEHVYNGPSGETPGEDSGTTACVAVLFKDKVVVGNAGDSRAVLCRNGIAVDLSADHKPEDDEEKKRIEAAGGEISADGRVNGGLNLSRALGDHFYKKNDSLPLKDQMISAQPDVTEQSYQPDDEFLIIACDGIWNSLSSQQAVDFVRKRIGSGVALGTICEQMCDECLAPNTSGDGTGCDNMTVIIAEFLRQ